MRVCCHLHHNHHILASDDAAAQRITQSLQRLRSSLPVRGGWCIVVLRSAQPQVPVPLHRLLIIPDLCIAFKRSLYGYVGIC
jgi:hypothetical protein